MTKSKYMSLYDGRYWSLGKGKPSERLLIAGEGEVIRKRTVIVNLPCPMDCDTWKKWISSLTLQELNDFKNQQPDHS